MDNDLTYKALDDQAKDSFARALIGDTGIDAASEFGNN